jgi:hypothetical protein
MKIAPLFALVFAAGGCIESDSSVTEDLVGQPEPPMLGQHMARDQAQTGGASGSPNLLWHDGQIMTSTTVTPIFWGPSWTNAAFAGDKITGLDYLYAHVGGTKYINTNTEYTGTNGQVTTSVSSTAHVVDTSATPRHAPKTSAIQAEVCKMISNPVANGYYPVYTDMPRGHAGYCAWHSYGTCNGVPVQFGFFFALDGDAGCDVNAQGSHSQGLESLANVSGHELSEMLTDPRNGGWWDSSGAENADKCAWVFPGTVTVGAQQWEIQGNWSNNAFDSSSGYQPRDNSGPGCLQEK